MFSLQDILFYLKAFIPGQIRKNKPAIMPRHFFYARQKIRHSLSQGEAFKTKLPGKGRQRYENLFFYHPLANFTSFNLE